MADPPPRKIGSLKDRIAAFEKGGGTPAPAPSPPIPRPKPGGLSTWKPRPVSPPPAATSNTEDAERKAAGMSAADAKESISKGGSLKERMAALQGRNALAGLAPAGVPPPRPASEKPKWKPPPVIAPPPEEEGEVSADKSEVEHPSSPPVEEQRKSVDEGTAQPQEDEDKEGEAQEPDSEEEERQRRAAIAARMARLGGARVGMGVPMFGRKPDVPKKPTTPKAEEPKEESPSADAVPTESTPDVHESSSPSAQGASSQDYFGEKGASTSSLLSPEPPSSAGSTQRSPAMPVPTIPRRAGPPRRKTPKSPSPAPASITDAPVSESPGAGAPPETAEEVSKELQEDVKKSKEDEVALGLEPVEIGSGEQHEPPHVSEEAVPEPDLKTEPSPAEIHSEAGPPTHEVADEDLQAEDAAKPVEPVRTGDDDEEEPAQTEDKEEMVQTEGRSEEAAEEPAEQEEDEETRRKQIAERLRQQGGFNPFSGPPPPVRKPSLAPSEPEITGSQGDSEQHSPPVSPPPPPRRQSVRQDSAGSNILPTSPGLGRRSSAQQQGSTEVQSPNEALRSPPPVPTSSRPPVTERKNSIASLRSASGDEQEIKEREEHEVQDDHQSSLLSENPHALTENITEEPEEDADHAFDEDTPAEQSHDESQADLNENESGNVQPVVASEPPARQQSLQRGDSVSSTRISALSKRTSLPPPPRAIPSIPQEASASLPPPSPPSSRRSLPPISQDLVEEDGNEHENDSTAPPQVKSPARELPLLASPAREVNSVAQESDEIERNLPPPPPPLRRQSTDLHSPRRSLPPPPPPPILESQPSEDTYEDAEEGSEREASDPGDYSEGDLEASDENHPSRPSSDRADDDRPPLAVNTSEGPEYEVLDDEDVDPIDPSFYSPQKSSSTIALPSAPASATEPVSPTLVEPPAQAEPAEPEPAVDEEQSRRRTIAERMAKLGGIKFGAPPPLSGMRPPPRTPSEGVAPLSEEGDGEKEELGHAEEPTEEPEEDEAARKQRIAARLAGMGGMRFGMMPGQAPPAPQSARPPQSQIADDEPPPPPPPRSAPLPPPAAYQQTEDSEAESEGVSDVVEVEAEESELEEVSREEVLEEAPPPVPSRQGRRNSAQPPLRSASGSSTSARPPVPVGRPPVPPPTSRPTALSQPSHDFVIVDQAEAIDEPPPLPPPRTASLKRGPPPRAAPPPPVPDLSASVVSQWENSVDFGGETDLSLSGQWSEDSTQYPEPSDEAAPPVAQPPQQAPAASKPQPANLSSDELMAQWGRVGIQIHEVATTLYEKSRKSLIGDGTHVGFVTTVLHQVPNASKPAPPYDDFGYLIYEQNGASVLKRASDIMPGDVIVLRDAKLKGHKGLQTYHQTIGDAQPVCAIIGDYEVKKSKVKVFQANQHVGHESVESVSYRLEDLRSGSVKVFRVLED